MRRKVLAATAAPALWLLHRDDHALGETEQPPAPHCCLEAASQVATPQQLQQRQQKGELPATLLALGATTLEALPRHLASFLTLHVHADSGASSNFSTSSTSSFHATAQQLQPRQQSAAAGAPPRLPPLPLPTAFRAALSYPLASYMGLPYASSPLSEEQLQQLEAAALAGWDGPDALQVVTVAWSLAWAGHRPGPDYLARLQAALSSGSLPSAPLSPTQQAVLLWAATLHGAANPQLWSAALARLAPAAAALDECAVMYLLHAALSHSAYGSSRTAGGTSGTYVGSPGGGSGGPACQPRATKEEVVGLLAPLGRKGQGRMATAYGEFVPLHPAVEGPYLAVLYCMSALKEQEALTAAAAAAARGGSGGWGASLGLGRGAASGGAPGGGDAGADWAPPGAVGAATVLLGSPKELSRLRRELLYHWRGDELLDPLQRTRNQAVYLLTRRLGITVSQPEDVDIAVPSRWLALYVTKSTADPDRTAGPSGGGSGGAAAQVVGLERLAVGIHEVVELLVRERFAPRMRQPVGGEWGLGGGARGLWAAREGVLRSRGWRVAALDADVWSGLGEDGKVEYLQRLLRGAGR